jgi:hypothetical protein
VLLVDESGIDRGLLPLPNSSERGRSSLQRERRSDVFWLACGFIQLDTIDPLPGWPPGNPAAILAVALAPTR